jgi:hypothetical protein
MTIEPLPLNENEEEIVEYQYATFGQRHYEPNGVIRFVGCSREAARRWMFEKFGPKWCMLYDGKELPEMYPLGAIRLVTASECPPAEC